MAFSVSNEGILNAKAENQDGHRISHINDTNHRYCTDVNVRRGSGSSTSQCLEMERPSNGHVVWTRILRQLVCVPWCRSLSLSITRRGCQQLLSAMWCKGKHALQTAHHQSKGRRSLSGLRSLVSPIRPNTTVNVRSMWVSLHHTSCVLVPRMVLVTSNGMGAW